MEGMAPSSPIRTDLPPSAETIKWKKSDEKYEDIKTAALGLVDVFKVSVSFTVTVSPCLSSLIKKKCSTWCLTRLGS